MKPVSLQYITDRIEGVEEALRGGCRWIQLRMKSASDEQFIAMGKEIGSICRRYNATFILDDRVHLVERLNADGVHLGKNDMPLHEARKLLGTAKFSGATPNTRQDVDTAVNLGADYLGIGPYRFTTTKERLAPILGIEGYQHIMSQAIAIPVVAIGGIELSDIPLLKSTGVDGIAVSGLISRSENPELTTKQILNLWTN